MKTKANVWEGTRFQTFSPMPPPAPPPALHYISILPNNYVQLSSPQTNKFFTTSNTFTPHLRTIITTYSTTLNYSTLFSHLHNFKTTITPTETLLRTETPTRRHTSWFPSIAGAISYQFLCGRQKILSKILLTTLTHPRSIASSITNAIQLLNNFTSSTSSIMSIAPNRSNNRYEALADDDPHPPVDNANPSTLSNTDTEPPVDNAHPSNPSNTSTELTLPDNPSTMGQITDPNQPDPNQPSEPTEMSVAPPADPTHTTFPLNHMTPPNPPLQHTHTTTINTNSSPTHPQPTHMTTINQQPTLTTTINQPLQYTTFNLQPTHTTTLPTTTQPNPFHLQPTHTTQPIFLPTTTQPNHLTHHTNTTQHYTQLTTLDTAVTQPTYLTQPTYNLSPTPITYTEHTQPYPHFPTYTNTTQLGPHSHTTPDQTSTHLPNPFTTYTTPYQNITHTPYQNIPHTNLTTSPPSPNTMPNTITNHTVAHNNPHYQPHLINYPKTTHATLTNQSPDTTYHTYNTAQRTTFPHQHSEPELPQDPINYQQPHQPLNSVNLMHQIQQFTHTQPHSTNTQYPQPTTTSPDQEEPSPINQPANDPTKTTATNTQTLATPSYASIAASNPTSEWLPAKPTHKKKPTPTPIPTQLIQASKLVWRDITDHNLQMQNDLAYQTLLITERRGDLNRPVVWLRFYLDITAPISKAPTPLEHESIVRTIISSAEFDFEVDIAWINTLQDPITIGSRKVYETYAALSPRITPNTTNTHHQTLDTLLATIEDYLVWLFADTTPIRNTFEPQANINFYEFSLPSVNDIECYLGFFIEGLEPSLLFNDTRAENTATHREIAADIFRSFRTLYNETYPTTPLPNGLARIKTQHETNCIISTRSSYIHTYKTSIVGITFSSTNPLAEKLKDAIRLLCIQNTRTLRICGNKVTITLHEAQGLSIETKKHIITTNSKMKDETTHIIFRNIPAASGILDDPDTISTIADCIPYCKGLFIDLSHGRLSPKITCVVSRDISTSYSLKLEDVTRTIQAFPDNQVPPTQTNIPPPTLTPPRGRGRTNYKQITSPAISQRKNIPLLTSLITTKERSYYALINGKGGHSTANVYHCSYEGDNLRYLVDHVNFNCCEQRNTWEEAFRLFTTYYPHCTTQEDIDFMNLNAPIDASNLNNPCPRIQHRISLAHRSNAITENMNFTFTANLSNPEIYQYRTLASQRKHNMPNIDSNTSAYDYLPLNFAPRKAKLPESTIYFIDKQHMNEQSSIILPLQPSTFATNSHQPPDNSDQTTMPPPKSPPRRQPTTTLPAPNTTIDNNTVATSSQNTYHKNIYNNKDTTNLLNIHQINAAHQTLDEMSIISQTESLTLSQTYASASKRQRYNSINSPTYTPTTTQPSFVNFLVPLHTTPSII